MKIFVVDDDPVARMITTDQLRDPGLEVHELEDGAALLAAIDGDPDLILLDIEMPGMDGFAAYRAIREAGNHHAQVIYLSSHDDLDSRLAAYRAGGSDFVVKPCEEGDLLEKVWASGRFAGRRRELLARPATTRTACAAMPLEEPEGLLQFQRAAFSCGNGAQLATALFQVLQQYGLHSLLEVRMASDRQCFSSWGEATPLEASILSQARGADRVLLAGDRLAINGPAVTLLVLNLPWHDPERLGRLGDRLAMAVDAIEARIQARGFPA